MDIFLFPFPFPLLLPLSCCSTNLEPNQYMLHIAGRAGASLVFSLHELTVHYSNKHYASQPMKAECMPVVTHIQV